MPTPPNLQLHNDYSFEIPPKFEIFPDRLEITSSGTLPDMLSKKEFFKGISVHRNKELMRVFNDLHLVESLGSGIPRILKAYDEDCFVFMDNYTRVIFPNSNQDSNQDDYQLGKAYIPYIDGEIAKTKAEIERIVEQNKKQFDTWSTESVDITEQNIERIAKQSSTSTLLQKPKVKQTHCNLKMQTCEV